MTAPATPASSQADPPAHATSQAQVLTRLRATAEGLSAAERARRLKSHGPNRLAPPRVRSAWRILLDQLRSVVVLLLASAAGVAAAFGETTEALAILAVLLVNAGLGFWMELRARTAISALLALEAPRARVVLDGRVHEIPAEQVVPGDVLHLEEGVTVPADARLLEATDLQTDEAALTGESTPVDKRDDPPCPPGATLPDRLTMVHMGSSVLRGAGRALVVATGDGTELGRIGRMVAAVESAPTWLEQRLDHLGRQLIGVTLGVGLVVAILGRARGAEWGLALETGLALAIAAVPEGLPAALTIALAVGVARMAARNALVRRLPAVETLGATTVLCTDKTGTLTAGRMEVTHVWSPDGEVVLADDGLETGPETLEDALPAAQAVLRAGVFANTATDVADVEPEHGAGDPVDIALRRAWERVGPEPLAALLSAHPRRSQIPFASARRWMSATYEQDRGLVTWVKGAPDVVLEGSDKMQEAGGVRPLDDASRTALRERNEELAARGLRVLALARRPGPEADRLAGLTWLGLVGFLDPPAEGAAETLAALESAGVRTLVLTGDQARTTRAVAERLGLDVAPAEVIDAATSGMSDRALLERLPSARIVSRVSPEDKLRMVTALQAGGEVVAMVGDGVNDAPALRQADVGVAMGGRGTDVAKAAADVVLRDDRLATIAVALEGGRVTYDNIRRFVFYLFSCNLAEVFVLLAAGLAGLPQPLLPLQILWLNLVTDTFPALALAVEPAEDDVLRRPPRNPSEPIVGRQGVTVIAVYAAAMALVSLAALMWGLRDGDVERARTLSFATLAFVQLFHLGNARSRGPVLRPSRMTANPWALGAVAIVLVLQGLAVHLPVLRSLLGLSPLSLGDWAVVCALAAAPALLGQARKVWRLPRHP